MLKLPETTVRQTKKNSQFRIRGGSVAIGQKKNSVVLAQSLEVSSQGRESEAVNMEEGRSGCLSVGPEIIFIFPRSLTMKRSENWRDLRSLKPKFRGIRFVGTEALIISWKSQFDPLRSVVIAQSPVRPHVWRGTSGRECIEEVKSKTKYKSSHQYRHLSGCFRLSEDVWGGWRLTLIACISYFKGPPYQVT